MTLEATVGVETSLDVWTAAGFTPEDPDNGAPDGGVPGLTWDQGTRTLDGTPTEAGEFSVTVWTKNAHNNDRSATVNVTVAPALDPEDPDDPDLPDLPPDEHGLDPWAHWGGLATALAPRVASFVGMGGSSDVIDTAEAQIPVVAEYVRGFTRGRGFDGEAPAGPLRAVIVSGTARLATNPEQVAHFQTGDYSERPAQLAGWTLAELGVLRRYRRVAA